MRINTDNITRFRIQLCNAMCVARIGRETWGEAKSTTAIAITEIADSIVNAYIAKGWLVVDETSTETVDVGSRNIEI